MIIIPLDRKLEWSNLPAVTLSLILINVLFFFIWQSGDDERFTKALDYYQESGLSEIEWKYYLDAETGEEEQSVGEDQLPKELAGRFHYRQITSDTQFMHKLLEDQVITPEDKEYVEWKSKRENFNELMSRVVYINWGLQTATPRWDSLLGHMFLHGSIMHLLGNMIFLLAVGFLVEGAIGHVAFLVCYLLVGFGSASFDFIFRPDDFTPSIGASGAIAGLMGMYTVLYWKKRIRFFYFIYVYFDYVSLPAIALLPLWIGNELFNIFSYPDSNVNYFAHLGGLVTGACLAGVIRLLRIPMVGQEGVTARARQEFEQQLGHARELCERMDYRQVLPLLSDLHSREPNSIQVMVLMQEAARIEPHGETYHRISRRLLSQPVMGIEGRELRKDVFRQYLKHARPGPKLSRELVCELLDWFIGIGAYREAEFLARAVVKKQWTCEGQVEMLYRLADLAEEKGESKKSVLYRAAAAAE
jgi:membrane associated rhomboid family serine protease